MKRSRAILLLITLMVAIGGYVAWAAWDPTPTIQTMKFGPDVGAVARSAAESDCRSYPPNARKLALGRFLNRLTNPYQPREDPSIRVEFLSFPEGIKRVVIYYPREEVHLHDRSDGTWFRNEVYKR